MSNHAFTSQEKKFITKVASWRSDDSIAKSIELNNLAKSIEDSKEPELNEIIYFFKEYGFWEGKAQKKRAQMLSKLTKLLDKSNSYLHEHEDFCRSVRVR